MKNKLRPVKIVLSISVLLLLNLVLLFYLKYSNHHLSFSDFSVAKVGNIINLTITLITIIGLMIILFKKIKLSTTIIYILGGLLFLFLVGVMIINSTYVPFDEYYLLSLSFTQVLIISSFGLFQFTQIFLMVLVWQVIFRVEKLIYLRSFVNTIFLLMGIFVFTLVFINTNPVIKKKQKTVDTKPTVAVVLGAAVWSDNKPSPSLALRVDKAAELYKSGTVQKIQLTGGNAPGELSEAEVSLNYILKKGVERKDILIEKNTTSTIEQIRFLKNKLMNDKQPGSLIIISDIYHIHRVNEICSFYNVNAEVTPSKLNLRTDKIIFYQLRECMALLLFWLFGI